MKKLTHKFSKVLRCKPKPVISVPIPEVARLQVSEAGTLAHANTVMNAVDTLADVDAYRRRLAGDDPYLHRVLGGIEMTLARQLGRQFNHPKV